MMAENVDSTKFGQANVMDTGNSDPCYLESNISNSKACLSHDASSKFSHPGQMSSHDYIKDKPDLNSSISSFDFNRDQAHSTDCVSGGQMSIGNDLPLLEKASCSKLVHPSAEGSTLNASPNEKLCHDQTSVLISPSYMKALPHPEVDRSTVNSPFKSLIEHENIDNPQDLSSGRMKNYNFDSPENFYVNDYKNVLPEHQTAEKSIMRIEPSSEALNLQLDSKNCQSFLPKHEVERSSAAISSTFELTTRSNEVSSNSLELHSNKSDLNFRDKVCMYSSEPEENSEPEYPMDLSLESKSESTSADCYPLTDVTSRPSWMAEVSKSSELDSEKPLDLKTYKLPAKEYNLRVNSVIEYAQRVVETKETGDNKQIRQNEIIMYNASESVEPKELDKIENEVESQQITTNKIDEKILIEAKILDEPKELVEAKRLTETKEEGIGASTDTVKLETSPFGEGGSSSLTHDSTIMETDDESHHSSNNSIPMDSSTERKEINFLESPEETNFDQNLIDYMIDDNKVHKDLMQYSCTMNIMKSESNSSLHSCSSDSEMRDLEFTGFDNLKVHANNVELLQSPKSEVGQSNSSQIDDKENIGNYELKSDVKANLNDSFQDQSELRCISSQSHSPAPSSEPDLKAAESNNSFLSLASNATLICDTSIKSVDSINEASPNFPGFPPIENEGFSRLKLYASIGEELRGKSLTPTHRTCIENDESISICQDKIIPQMDESDIEEGDLCKVKENNDKEFIYAKESNQNEDNLFASFSTFTPSTLNNMEYRPALDETFDWDQYLQETNSEAAPPTSFMHVEQSLETGVKEGQCLEVLTESHEEGVNADPHSTEDSRWASFWPANVTAVCGNLLRIRYLGTTAKPSKHLEFWCDLSSKHLKPVGWSLANNVAMSIPPKVLPTVPNLLLDERSLANLDDVPEEIFTSTKREIYSRIEEGSHLELMNSQKPHEGRVVKVIRNHGGRLMLGSPLQRGRRIPEHLWIFFLDTRLKPLNWIKCQGEPYRYEDEESLKLVDDSKTLKTTSELPFQASLKYSPPEHSLEVGMHLEVVSPITLQTIHIGVISKILDDVYFEVSASGHRWITTLDDPLLFPCYFCQDHYLDLTPPLNTKGEFKWDDYLASVGGKMIPQECFPQRTHGSELGFEEGHKLETANPSDPNKICIATIERVVQSLLLLKIDAYPDSFFYRAASSMELFPIGWTQSHNLPLYVPSFQASGTDSSDIQTQGDAALPENSPSSLSSQMKTGKTSNSMWCPRLYINHFCYPGPYLSKMKVSKMPRAVGPGPVPLVLRDVIGMTINAGYIPTRVLRELQNLHGLNSSWQEVLMKAKFKRHILKASVIIPSAAREVGQFLLEFSKILMSCPNLWSHEPIGENCHYVCNRQNLSQIANGSSVFRGKGLRGTSSRRKRGGKKRLFYPLKASANSEDGVDRQRDGEEEEFGEQEDGEEGIDEGLSGSEGESRPSSPSLVEGQRKLKQKRILSSLEITMNESRPFDVTKERGTKRSRMDAESVSLSLTPPQRKQGQTDETRSFVNGIKGLKPAVVNSDPLEWSVDDVSKYVASQASVSHFAGRLKEQEVDGRALLLLNLPSLIHHLKLPHRSAVTLAQHICKIKLAHFLYFYPEHAVNG